MNNEIKGLISAQQNLQDGEKLQNQAKTLTFGLFNQKEETIFHIHSECCELAQCGAKKLHKLFTGISARNLNCHM